jgi:hypothetical protein
MDPPYSGQVMHEAAVIHSSSRAGPGCFVTEDEASAQSERCRGEARNFGLVAQAGPMDFFCRTHGPPVSAAPQQEDEGGTSAQQGTPAQQP